MLEADPVVVPFSLLRTLPVGDPIDDGVNVPDPLVLRKGLVLPAGWTPEPPIRLETCVLLIQGLLCIGPCTEGGV